MGVQFLNSKEEWNGENACQIINKTDQSKNKSAMNDTSEWKAFITNWNGIIDSRTFLMCQERLSQNVALSRDNTTQNKFKELTGLVKCAKCGKAIKIRNKYGSMTCVSRSELRGSCDASFRGIRVNEIQEKVEIEIQEYLDNFVKNQEKWKKKKEEYEKQAEKTETEIRNLVLNLAQSPEIEKAITNVIVEKQKELAEINVKMQLDVSTSDKIEYRVLKVLRQINPKNINIKDVRYNELGEEEKQALLKILVEKILLFEDKSIKIIWKA